MIKKDGTLYKTTSTKITKKDFEHLEDIIINAGELEKKVPYDKLVY